MTYNYRPRREKCPTCGKWVAISRSGRMVSHIGLVPRKLCRPRLPKHPM